MYGALTTSYWFAARAAYQLDRSSSLICTSNPTAFSDAWICWNSDRSAGTDWLVETGNVTVRRCPSFTRTPSLPTFHPALSRSSSAFVGEYRNRLLSEYAYGSTLDSTEYERFAVPRNSDSMPGRSGHRR